MGPQAEEVLLKNAPARVPAPALVTSVVEVMMVHEESSMAAHSIPTREIAAAAQMQVMQHSEEFLVLSCLPIQSYS